MVCKSNGIVAKAIVYEMESNQDTIFPQKGLIGTAHSQSVLGQSMNLEEENFLIFNPTFILKMLA